MHACFIDLKKAFDSVDHISLLYKLKILDFGNSVYSLIKDMYVNIGTTLSVKSGLYLSGSFQSRIGVRKGMFLAQISLKFICMTLKNI